MNKKAISEAKKELKLINTGINQAKKGKSILVKAKSDIFAYNLSDLVRFYTLVATGQTKKAKSVLNGFYSRDNKDIIVDLNKDILACFEGMTEVQI